MSAMRRGTADIGVVVASVGTAAVLSVAYNAVAGRQLGPAMYSDFAGGVALATLLSVALGALAPITAHLTARYAAAGEHGKIRGLVARLLRIVGIIVAGALLIGTAIAFPLARALQFSSPWIVPAAVAVFGGMAAGALVRAALRGAQRFTTYGGNLVAEAAVRLVFGVAVLEFTGSATLGVLAYALAMLVVLPPALGSVRRLSGEIERVDLREVTSMLGPMALLVGAMAVYGNVDLIIVKRLFDPAEAGIYGAAATLARSMIVVIMPLEVLLLPRLTYLSTQRVGPVREMTKVVAIAGAVAFLPLLAFAAAPVTIVRLLYGAPFATAGPLLFPLAASILAVCFAYLAGQVLISTARSRAVSLFVLGVVIEVGLLVTMARSLESVVSILLLTRSCVLLVMVAALWIARSQRAITES